jgi:hypothetical protein
VDSVTIALNGWCTCKRAVSKRERDSCMEVLPRLFTRLQGTEQAMDCKAMLVHIVTGYNGPKYETMLMDIS